MYNILVNGKPCDHVSALDRGLHYGDGLFETFKVAKGRIMFFKQHLQRLQHGCLRLRIPQPSEDELLQEAKQLLGGEEKAALKIIITRGRGGRGYRLPENINNNRIIIRYAFPDHPQTNYYDGVKIRLCDIRLSTNPVLAGIKHLNRLEQVIARSEWHDESIAEGLMFDQTDNIVEGTMSNVFLVQRGRLVTPDLKNCGVAGIIRQYVLNAAQDLGISHDITEVRKEDLLAADEVFLTNSLIGIWPVRTLVENHPQNVAQDYKIGSIAKKLIQTLAKEEAGQEV